MVVAFSEQYREDVYRLVKEFQEESLKEYGLSFDLEALKNTVEELKSQIFLLTSNDKCVGLLAGKLVKTPISPNPIWHEVIWFVEKEHRSKGVRLFYKVKAELKQRGFDTIVMVCMHNSKTEKLFKFYKRLGLTAMETHWIGRL